MLRSVQASLQDIYELELEHRIDDFLITNAALAQHIDESPNPRRLPEKLLVQQHEDSIGMTLFLDADLIARLERRDPFVRLDRENFRDFMIAVEGVSHFVCLAWHASFDKQISLLELELQAEIDKFVLAAGLLARQHGHHSFHGLHDTLFAAPVFDNRLVSDELQRYQAASRYAAKFCHYLQRRFRHAPSQLAAATELRRFYRLPKVDKLTRINQLLA